MKPYGWTEGSTLDSVGTVCMGTKLVIARTTINNGASKQIGLSDVPHYLYHDMGHLFWNVRRFGENRELKEAYEKDKEKIPDEERQKLSYFLQDGTGEDETFSEMFSYANVKDGDTNPYSYQEKLFLDSFPNVKRFVEEACKHPVPEKDDKPAN